VEVHLEIPVLRLVMFVSGLQTFDFVAMLQEVEPSQCAEMKAGELELGLR